MLFTVIQKNEDGDVASKEYPLPIDVIYDRYLAPAGKSKIDVDLEFLASMGVYPVRPTNQPSFDRNQRVQAVVPVLIDGEWVEEYVIVSKTEEEIATDLMMTSAGARQHRNTLLMLCDWTQIADSPLSEEKKQEWATYRQALRDIPLQEGYPFSINWPAQP